MIGIFLPKPHIKRLESQDAINRLYKLQRFRTFLGLLIGYSGYYLVRKNFALAMPFLIEQGFSKAELGFILSSISIAYGFSCFCMGTASDQSDPRYFFSFGLLGSGIVMLILGFCDWATSSVGILFLMLFINGWIQGCGSPTCYKIIVHWWNPDEKGRVISWWNVGHCIGAGLAGPLFVFTLAFFGDWKTIFYVNGAVAVATSIFIWATIRDTPQSMGLPPVEEHTGYEDTFKTELNSQEDEEQHLGIKEIITKYILPNKVVWAICMANIFVYTIRYGVLDWSLVYLNEVKGFSLSGSSWGYLAYEWAGVAGTLMCGYLSDRLPKQHRMWLLISMMALCTGAIVLYWIAPAGNELANLGALVLVGLLIYGPVMLVGYYAIEQVPKKAAATVGGLIGMFAYVGGGFGANIAIGWAIDHLGWDSTFLILIGAAVGCIGCLLYAITHVYQSHSKLATAN